MRESAGLDELDLGIVNALQVSPRAPWSLIGGVLDVDAATVARRWARLTDAGQAWVTCYPGLRRPTGLSVAFVELDCAAGRTVEVARAAAAMPHVVTVEHVSGGRGLYLTVFVSDLAALSHFLLEEVAALPGATATRTQVASHVYTEGSRWEVGALDTGQRARLERARASSARRPAGPLSATDQHLAALLAEDGRQSYTDLASRAEISVSTARRRINHLFATRHLTVRCEVSRVLSNWPVTATVWANVAPPDLDEVAPLVASLPETRLCVALTGGPANLLFCLWLRTTADLQRLEGELGRRFPQLGVLDRALGLRYFKRMGRILDDADCSTGVVPLAAGKDTRAGAVRERSG